MKKLFGIESEKNLEAVVTKTRWFQDSEFGRYNYIDATFEVRGRKYEVVCAGAFRASGTHIRGLKWSTPGAGKVLVTIKTLRLFGIAVFSWISRNDIVHEMPDLTPSTTLL